MGSVFLRRRNDARAKNWYIEYSYGGKRIRKLAKGARTKSEAKVFLREIERQIDRGEYVPRKKKEVLLEVFAEDYMKWAKTNKLSWKRDQIFVNHFNSFFKNMMLHEITPMLIEDYKRKRKEKVSGSTVNRELACLKHILNMAINEGIVSENPVKKVRFFREDNLTERILTENEKKKLMMHCNGYLKAIIITALNTGMRRGEILNLRWQQIDLKRNILTVEKTKSGRSRKIPINSTLESVLGELWEKRESEEYVFPNKKTKTAVKNIKKSFKNACEKAGIRNLRFHDLRHTFATRLVEAGVDIATVSELLGHSTIVLTKRYSHPSPRHKREAVEALVGKEGKKPAEILTELLTEGSKDLSKRQILN